MKTLTGLFCVFCGEGIEYGAAYRQVTRYSCPKCWPPKEDVSKLVVERDRYRQALEEIEGVSLTERGFADALNIARKALGK